MTRAQRVWTIVVGGGSGTRFGRPKQYERVGDERVLDRSRRIAEQASDGVVVVVPPADAAREGGVAGGATRSDSVRAGLAAVPDDATVICVHDAARPLATVELYRRVVTPTSLWVHWDAPDHSYVLVGDLPPDHLTEVLAELPEPGRRNVLVRLWRRLFG